MKRKLVSPVILSSLLAVSLTACSTATQGNAPSAPATGGDAPKTATPAASTASAGKAVEITYWNLFGGGDGDFMDAMVKKFNDTHADSIVVKPVRLEWGEYYTKLMAAVASGTGPDVGISHATRLPELVAKNVATPLDPIAPTANVDWSAFNDNILASTVFDNKHYAIPLDTHAQAYFYNKKLLKDYGLLGDDGKPKIDPGPDGLVKFLTAIKDKSGGKTIPMVLPTAQGSDIYWLWWTFYKQLGGKGLFTDDFSKADFNNEQGKAATEFLGRLIKQDKVLPGDLTPDNFQKLFEDGKAATGVMGVWATGALEKVQGLDFGVIPMPTIFNQPAVWGDSHTLILPTQKNPNPEKQKAALTFANWISQNGAMWAQAGHVPAYKAVLTSDDFKKLPYRSDYAATTANNVKYFSKSPKQWPVNDAIQAVLNQFASNPGMTAAQALSQMEAETNKVLSK
jgi:multiple sugar transport system substrate-binding protein